MRDVYLIQPAGKVVKIQVTDAKHNHTLVVTADERYFRRDQVFTSQLDALVFALGACNQQRIKLQTQWSKLDKREKLIKKQMEKFVNS